MIFRWHRSETGANVGLLILKSEIPASYPSFLNNYYIGSDKLWLKYMSGKHPFHVWKEAISSKPKFRDSFKRMHLSVLHQAVRQQMDKELLFMQFEVEDFVLCEWKGKPQEMLHFELPDKDGGVLWFCMQFQGKCTLPNGTESDADTLFTFVSNSTQYHLTLPIEKVWMLFLGVSGASRQQVMSEYALLRHEYSRPRNNRTVALPITYLERQALEVFSRAGFGSFTTLHHIGLLYSKCYASYVQQLERRKVEEGQEASLVLLHHRAIAYVQEHYMQAGINRVTIAGALNCSTRQLSRAFEGRPITIGSAILLMRLHKGRELLRDEPHLSIEQIAGMLHFSDAKHFAKQYKKYFHHSPRQARKDISDWR